MGMSYRLSKRVISQYIRTGCRRRLRLDLYAGGAARQRADAPPKDTLRPGLTLLARQGKEYERVKFAELEEVFSSLVVRGELRQEVTEREDRAFASINLGDTLGTMESGQFALEAQFEVVDTFVAAHCLEDLVQGSATIDGCLTFDAVRPDIIHLRPPSDAPRRIVTAAGRLERISSSDNRIGLRIIDIKIAGEPTPAHFAELAYYCMALASWLEDSGRQDRFVVLAEAAIWPGRHEGSAIQELLNRDRNAGVRILDVDRYLEALEQDLITMPPEVVLGRVQRFLQVDLREVLEVHDWRELPWHIRSNCAGCDYLGYLWSQEESGAERPSVDERYCWPTAELTGHLSRIAGLTVGACSSLRLSSITNIEEIAGLTAGSPVFEAHQMLRAKRTVLRARAEALRSPAPANIPDRAGTSAVLPRFADIRVAVSADFDVGSGLTFALGYRIQFGIPDASYPQGIEGPRYRRRHREIERPMLVTERSLRSEAQTTRTWLEHLAQDILAVRDAVLAGYRQEGSTGRTDVSLQFYIWDRLTYNHFCRVFGRHLQLLQSPLPINGVEISPLSWIFPAETLLEEATFVARSSPISIVSDAVSSLLSAPIPHHYGIIDLANSFDPELRRLPNGQTWNFGVNRFYRDPLSDQIPSERGNEIWERISPFRDQDYQWHMAQVRTVVERKLHAISYVVDSLTRILGEELRAEAPKVDAIFQKSNRLTGVADDGQIIFQHARLMAACQQLEIDLLMAMPPHEREARFKSARVLGVLTGEQRGAELARLDLQEDIPDQAVWVFRLSHRSREVRMKAGEFQWSFMPEANLPDLQEITVAQYKRDHPVLQTHVPLNGWDQRTKLRSELRVTILNLDRAGGVLVVRVAPLLNSVLQLGLMRIDFDPAEGRFGILDPISTDFFTSKVRKTLEDQSGIRNPAIARSRPLFRTLEIARVRPGQPRPSPPPECPAPEFIWDADRLSMVEIDLPIERLLSLARTAASNLTERQREAIVQSATRRLALWWGPPGTGKSHTVQALVAALVALAVHTRQPCRVAITGFTWIAIDNVARRLPELLRNMGVWDQIRLFRLCSQDSENLDIELRQHAVVTSDRAARAEVEGRLESGSGPTIVAGTVDQLFKLRDPDRCAPLFDTLIIDEASQLDVGHSIVGFSKLAPNCRVLVVGDDRQMAPIHPLGGPEGQDHILGSIYDFYRLYRQTEGAQYAIRPVMLNRNFRSNREIVEFVREAGYNADLEASEVTAGLRIATVRPMGTVRPGNWPERIPFSPNWARILSPEQPLSAVVHGDSHSSQRNDAEADLVAGLVLTLFRAGLCDLEAGAGFEYTANDFFARGIGIVTPHRAQQAAVFERLADVLPPGLDRNIVYQSVDTVERFQGQERAVILASFGLGDPDQIAAEEEFLFSLNRFNVTVSRAKAKFVAVVSRTLVDHLPRDRDILDESRLLKYFVDGFLAQTETIELPGLGQCELKTR